MSNRVRLTPTVGTPPTSMLMLFWPSGTAMLYQSTSSSRWTRPDAVVPGVSGRAVSGVSSSSATSAVTATSGGWLHSSGPSGLSMPHSPRIDRYVSLVGASSTRTVAGSSM